MFVPLNTLRLLGAAAFDAAAMLTWHAADNLWEDAKRRMCPPPGSNMPTGYIVGSDRKGV